MAASLSPPVPFGAQFAYMLAVSMNVPPASKNASSSV